MKNKFIIDKEINLNENDFLNTKIYSDNLTKIIKNAEPNKVFTIGLFGRWGTGKSSIINTSEQDFKDDTNIKFIKYDAWQYINDSFRRMFLLKLREELNYDETPEMRRFYENESTDVGSKYQLSPTLLVYILSSLVILLGILSFIPFDINYKLPIYSILTLLGLLISIISGAFHQLKISVTKPHLFAPEQFEDCFKDIISHSLKTVNPIRKKWNWIVKNDKSIQNLDRLVIVIDNIDRCSNDLAYSLLTDVKTFLGSEPYSIIFIIPVDDEALKTHIINNNKINLNGEREEFLRKFFNVTIRIKPYVETDMYSFAKRICEKSNLKFKPETINIASKEYARNPRRIIQLFNNLLAEMNYYDSDFRERNETLICCILIIREEYPEYYKAIINSPKIFKDIETEYGSEVKRFKRISQTALGSVNISELNQVLTNSHYQFNNIAADIKDAVDTFDSDKVISVWEKEKDGISDYIIDKLENAIKYNLIETDLVSYFDLCAKINLKYSLEIHFTKRIDEKILPRLEKLIFNTSNYENLCQYALTRETQEDKTLRKHIVNYCIREHNQARDTYWVPLFKAVINTFQDKETSQKLSSTFDLYHQDIDIKKLSKVQIEILLSDKFVQGKLNNLSEYIDNKELSTIIDSQEYQLIKWIFENKNNISQDTFGHLFAIVIGENNDSNDFDGKTTDEIINFINPLLDLIPDKLLSTQPKSLYDLIVNDRLVKNRMNNRSYYQGTVYVNFIDESIKNNEYIEEISDYIFNTYRITDNKTDTRNEIEKLLQNTNVNNRLLELINKEFSLHPFVDIIVSNLNIDESTTDNDKKEIVNILEFCLKQTDEKGDYILPDNVVKTKLDRLLSYSYQNKDPEIFSFLEVLTTIDYYNKILSSLILQKESDLINSLPKKLLTLALNSFGENNYADYSENFDFLSVIVQNGNMEQKKYVVKILIENLINNETIEETIKLIELMQDIPSFDKSGLLYSHLNEYQQENKGSIDAILNKKINAVKQRAKV